MYFGNEWFGCTAESVDKPILLLWFCFLSLLPALPNRSEVFSFLYYLLFTINALLIHVNEVDGMRDWQGKQVYS
jgi:hypothetical protein